MRVCKIVAQLLTLSISLLIPSIVQFLCWLTLCRIGGLIILDTYYNFGRTKRRDITETKLTRLNSAQR